MGERAGAGTVRPLRVAVAGVSESATCGMRAHAELLADALGHEQVDCELHWMRRSGQSPAAARAEFRAWTEQLRGELARERPDAVLLHYSVFSYSYRGLPVFVPATISALRAAGVPLVTFMHEFVYPWRRGGARGTAWAISQRAALIDVARRSASLVVTTPTGASWVGSRRWLAARSPALAPVFSNLPAPGIGVPPEAGTLGLFGYAYEGADAMLVLEALRILRARGLTARLRLLGAPGPDSAAAERWRQGARERGLHDLLSFSGVLAAQELSDALARCEVLLHPEPSGPTSRKGTLAASLASGRPVVALDGPRAWQELLDAGAASVVAPTAAALAEGVARLLSDEREREALGARGGAFARDSMGVSRSAAVVARMLREAAAGTR
jgi:hypothetical protein